MNFSFERKNCKNAIFYLRLSAVFHDLVYQLIDTNSLRFNSKHVCKYLKFILLFYFILVFCFFFSCFWYFFFKEGEQTSFKSLRSVRWKMFKTFQFYRKDIFLQGKLGGKGIKRGGPMNERGAKKWNGGQGMEGIWKNHNPLSRM